VDQSGENPRPGPYFPLPKDLPNPREAARTVFDRIAELYDAARPGYPPEAIAELVDRCKVGPNSSVLEVGCGTGQLTRSLAPLGCRIRCLEPGPALAERARSALSAFPNVEVVTTPLEEADERPQSFDLLVSATAFHWVNPKVAFAKAAQVLRPGAFLALLTNAHGAGGTQESIAAEVQALHQRLAPDAGTWEFPSVEEVTAAAEQEDDIATVWQRVERKFEAPPPVGDLFEAPLVGIHPWLDTYDRQGYLQMLRSQSSYALMEPAKREELLGQLGELIDARLFGTVTKQYITVLAVARRR
jgi:SAM-dependent methyltransferase